MGADDRNDVDLVITAPEEFGAALAHATGCRTTVGVLMQLVSQASRRIMIAAPFVQAEYGKPAELIKCALLEAAERNGLILMDRGEWWHKLDLDKPPRLASFIFEKPRSRDA